MLGKCVTFMFFTRTHVETRNLGFAGLWHGENKIKHAPVTVFPLSPRAPVP